MAAPRDSVETGEETWRMSFLYSDIVVESLRGSTTTTTAATTATTTTAHIIIFSQMVHVKLIYVNTILQQQDYGTWNNLLHKYMSSNIIITSIILIFRCLWIKHTDHIANISQACLFYRLVSIVTVIIRHVAPYNKNCHQLSLYVWWDYHLVHSPLSADRWRTDASSR